VTSFLSCLYVIHYKDTPSSLLKVFLALTGKSIDATRSYLISSSLFYDEDFLADTRGLSLRPDVSKGTGNPADAKTDEEWIKWVDETIETLQKTMDLAVVDASLDLKGVTDQKPYAQAILDRFRFIRVFPSSPN